MPYEPLHHKYRPQTFGDLVGQETIALTLSNALKQEKIAPAYLFTGPRGTGKTSSARILAKSLNCLTSSKPTPQPCGQCEACLAIAKGSALDVMEIDAASNTGVDNIREIIERSRFAPVQCRYKIYAIDECLTGDSLIQTSEGLKRIDDPNLKGKLVLSYNENTQSWEDKKVLRWLERGIKETLIIKTSKYQIRCTENHLIRTDKGWIEAKNVQEGMKILSPVIFPNKDQKNNTQFPQWTTNLEKVESVRHAGREKVYDLEVEDNHNFVANGLLVHNCHMLSTAAFNALLKTLEEPPPNVVFILATTDPQRVLSTIISRCQRFDYRRIPLGEMTKHLKYIAQQENIAIADEALTLIAQIANGGLRDAESLLDQLSLLPDEISVAKVWDLVGAVPEQDLIKLLQAISSQDTLGILQQCRSLLDRGREPLVVLQNLASFYLNLLIAKTAPHHPDMVAVTETCWQQLCQEANNWDTSLILQGQQHLKEAETQLKRTTQPRLWLEVTLLGLLSNNNSSSATNNVVNQSLTVVHQMKDLASPDNSGSKANSSLPNQLTSQPNNPSTEKIVAKKTSQPEKPLPQPKETEKKLNMEQDNLTPSISHPAPVKEVSPSEQVNAPINQKVTTKNVVAEKIDTAKLWSQVVSCLHPPTTQALLKQQCHLVSFDGSSAIVGISSARLQKLHQGKVANIEAAFAQVCQRQIKVQLEAASLQPNSVKNSVPSTDNSPSQTIQSSAARSSPSQSLEVNPYLSTSKASYSKTPSENFSSHAKLNSNTETINDVAQEQKAVNDLPVKSNFRGNSTRQSLPEFTQFTSNSQTATSSASAVSSSSATQPENKVLSPLKPILGQNSSLDYTDDKLQQAIDNLTQNFEGELVQLNDNQEEFFPTSEPEDASKLNRGRPNQEDYDDDW